MFSVPLLFILCRRFSFVHIFFSPLFKSIFPFFLPHVRILSAYFLMTVFVSCHTSSLFPSFLLFPTVCLIVICICSYCLPLNHITMLLFFRLLILCTGMICFIFIHTGKWLECVSGPL